MNIYRMLLEILTEIQEKESNLSIAGGKGYSAGKAYPNKTVSVSRHLGKERNPEQEEYTLKPVKVSKIFKRRKNDKRSSE